MAQQQFTAKWLPTRLTLKLQTTPQHYSRIVDQLNNPVRRMIVNDGRRKPNTLVLAGSGSGKTRILVHRIAYLIKVKRERPESIILLAYNRHAAAPDTSEIESPHRRLGPWGDFPDLPRHGHSAHWPHLPEHQHRDGK